MKTIKLLAVVDTNMTVYGSDQEAKWTIDGAVRQASANLSQQLGIDLEVVEYQFQGADTAQLQRWFLEKDAAPDAHVMVIFTNRKVPEPDGAYSVMNDIHRVCDELRPTIVLELQNDSLDGLTLAHALGHTLGMPHDADRGWQMTAHLRESDYFSAASIDAAVKLDTSCLVPQTIVPAYVPPGTTEHTGGGGCMGWGFLAVILAVLAASQGIRAERWKLKHMRAMEHVHFATSQLDEMSEMLQAERGANRAATPQG